MLIKINNVVASILQNIGFNNLKVVNMIFHQLFDKESSTFTYLIGCAQTQKAALIDPVESETKKYIALLDLLGLKLIYTLETHVHADHITGADLLRKKLGSKSVVHKDSGAKCADILVNDNDKLMVGMVITRFARRLVTSNLQSFKCHRAHLVKIAMTTFTIVKHFNVLKYV
jgi:glyoxylase-like metal-dependent hydrolase (beta-lactamase superfamily II)